MKTSQTFRKGELRLNAERGTNTWGNATLSFYKAMEYRWEDGETADPQIDDESYHLTKEEAIEAAAKIKLDLGFAAVVDKITIEYDDFNSNVEFGEYFELSKLDNYKKFSSIDFDTVYNGGTYVGERLNKDAIIVAYRHHRYMNYSYDITDVDFVSAYPDFETEADLRNDRDSTFSTYYITFKDTDELAEYFERGYFPFDKINSGSRLVREFLAENGHPDYIEELEAEDEE